MRMQRTARQHDTLSATAGVQSEDYADFRPKQRVMTCDGYAGRVTAVQDGPFPGSEAYEVTLDGGMGGGTYTAGQLRAVAEEAHTAAGDYPELGEVLSERPDPAKQVVMAKKATTQNGTRIDGHGEAPHEVRAKDPNGYDEKSTEGDPDPIMSKPLSGRDEKGAHGGELGRAPAGVSFEGAMSPAQTQHVKDREDARQQVVDQHAQVNDARRDRTTADDVIEKEDPAYANYLDRLSALVVKADWEDPEHGADWRRGDPFSAYEDDGRWHDPMHGHDDSRWSDPEHGVDHADEAEDSGTAHAAHLHLPQPEDGSDDLVSHMIDAHGYEPEQVRQMMEVHRLLHGTHEMDHETEPGGLGLHPDDFAMPHDHPDRWLEHGSIPLNESQVGGMTGGHAGDAEHAVTDNKLFELKPWHRNQFSMSALDPREAITNSGRYAKETRDDLDSDARLRGHDMDWKGVDLNAKGKAAHFVGECKNCGHTAVAGAAWSSTHSHATCDARHSTCEGPGSKWKTEMVNELMNKRIADAVSEFGQNVKNEQDKGWLRDHGIEAARKADPYGFIASAAADPDLRFHLTAAWADVRSKAKRIRTEGNVRITMASDGLVIGEVKGDHNTYESGIQRLPGSRHGVAHWSCGCKWGAYHWGASDDFSRFAGRMCSHALALQFEAQSRGMFGKTVEVDTSKPDWVPPRVVVKYNPGTGHNDLARSSSLRDGELVPVNIFAFYALHDGESGPDIRTLLIAAGLVEGSTNSPFGERVVEVPAKPYGATQPANKWESPASSGFLSAPDPEGWDFHDPNGLSPMSASLGADEALFEPHMATQDEARDADLSPEEREARWPQLASTQGPYEDPDSPGDPEGLQATLHPEPEGALPETDGEREDMVGEGAESLTPDDQSMMTMGNQMGGGDEILDEATDHPTEDVQDVVASFQASAAAKGLMSGAKGGSGGPSAREGASGAPSDDAIAARARQVLALKAFSPSEQRSLIDEAPGQRAANFDRLDIAGTHYADMDEDEGDGSWLL